MNLVSVCDFFFHLIQFSSSGTDGLMAQDLVNLENNPNSTKLFFVILVSCCNPVCVAECKFHMYIPNQFSSINAKFWFRLRVFILVAITFFGVTHNNLQLHFCKNISLLTSCGGHFRCFLLSPNQYLGYVSGKKWLIEMQRPCPRISN
jgi:hypothetical protein